VIFDFVLFHVEIMMCTVILYSCSDARTSCDYRFIRDKNVGLCDVHSFKKSRAQAIFTHSFSGAVQKRHGRSFLFRPFILVSTEEYSAGYHSTVESVKYLSVL
jgi:hypothetical protein